MKKKILITGFDFRPRLGGVATYSHEVAKALSRDNDVLVLAREVPNQTWLGDPPPYTLQTVATSSSAIRSFAQWAQAIRKAIDEFQPDLIFNPLWFPDGAATYWAQKGRQQKIPYFISVHAMEIMENSSRLKDKFRKLILRGIKKSTFAAAKKVLPVSRSTDRELRKQFPELKTLEILNNGVNTDIFFVKKNNTDFINKHSLQNKKILLSVCRLLPHKGIDTVLQSLPQVLQKVPNLTYIIAGDGPDKLRLQKMVTDLGLQNHVLFLGSVQESVLIDLYNLAHLFVLVSREVPPAIEGFGLVFLEAAACGLPAIGSRSGGIPDAIYEGQTGWLVDPHHVSLLAQKMIEVLTTDKLLADYSQNCLEKVKQLTWRHKAQRLNEIFHEA